MHRTRYEALTWEAHPKLQWRQKVWACRPFAQLHTSCNVQESQWNFCVCQGLSTSNGCRAEQSPTRNKISINVLIVGLILNHVQKTKWESGSGRAESPSSIAGPRSEPTFITNKIVTKFLKVAMCPLLVKTTDVEWLILRGMKTLAPAKGGWPAFQQSPKAWCPSVAGPSIRPSWMAETKMTVWLRDNNSFVHKIAIVFLHPKVLELQTMIKPFKNKKTSY